MKGSWAAFGFVPVTILSRFMKPLLLTLHYGYHTESLLSSLRFLKEGMQNKKTQRKMSFTSKKGLGASRCYGLVES